MTEEEVLAAIREVLSQEPTEEREQVRRLLERKLLQIRGQASDDDSATVC